MIAFRLLKWITNRIGAINIITLFLLIIALSSLIFTVADRVRGLSLALLIPVALVALLLGRALARLSFVPGWLAALLITILGVEAIAIRIGRLDIALLGLGQNGLYLAWQLWRWPIDGAPDLTPLLTNLVDLGQGLNILLSRLVIWLFSLGGGQPAFDPIAASLVWSLVLWSICAWAGWAIARLAQPLAALAPAGILLSTILAYRPSQATNLLPMLTATLLLLGLTGHNAREKRWQAANVDFAREIRADLGFVIIPLTVALIALAGFAPSLSLRQIARIFQDPFRSANAQTEPLADSLGLDRQPQDTSSIPQLEIRAPGLPRRHLLGSGPELSKQIALRINTGLAPAPYEEFVDVQVPRHYWRSLTYDRYTGRGWTTSATDRETYDAGRDIFTGDDSRWRVLRQRVETLRNHAGLLHLTGNLVTTDQEFNIDWRGSGDIFAITLDNPEAYQVDSLVPAAPFTESELQAASTIYPESILDSYLELPDTVPERVLALALDLTATQPTAYDRAKALETYLRQFTYNLDLPEPPVRRDMVDYFLFDLQEGYCDYYATAMVVLARSAGLPARLAVGYASGGYDPVSADYIVTEADAHSWVEIYFPDYGWVEFEPTAARPVPDRSETAPQPDYANTTLPPLIPSTQTGGVSWFWWLLLGTILLPLVALLAWLLADSWRLGRLAPAAGIAQLYNRMHWHGRWLVMPIWQGQTPYEFIETLTTRVETLASGQRWAILLNPTGRELRQLTDLYVRTSYSNHPPDIDDQRQAIKTWRSLRPRLWLAWLTALLKNYR